MTFNILYELSQWTNPPLIPTIVQDEMSGATGSVEGVLTYLLTPILPNVYGKPTIDLEPGLSP